MFNRVLIANRGEIALRVIRACRELGVESVCVYSQADADAAYLDLADEAICIGPGAPAESYLDISRIIAAAEIASADAIHPGYGFLAENAHFAEVCRDCKIEFIGPSPEAMALLGDKVAARKLAKKSRVPIAPGSDGVIDDEAKATEVAERIGYPVIVKAAAGGGGRGMRIVRSASELHSALGGAQQEAQAAFGNGAVFIEKFLTHARHIEVQVLGDKHGAAVHLYERDCSVQRRHQKLLEESPAPDIDPKRRDEVCKAAAKLIRNAEYAGAATVEFLLDEKQGFSMLEVNTRVQVEHPVSEMVTGIDIVQMQLLIASGEPLPMKQREIRTSGHAIECRINAEDPDRNFAPAPGFITRFDAPGGPGVRVDTHCVAGYRVPTEYDSMLGKLIVHGKTRPDAIRRMSRALRELRIEPIPTTASLHRRLMENSSFLEGGVDIHFLERLLAIPS